MTNGRHIGGSIFASGGSDIYQPIPLGTMTLQVKPSAELDTHFLTITHENGTSRLAEHPNGHSCKALADRMVAGDIARVTEQRDYIERCGGMARPVSTFEHYLKEALSAPPFENPKTFCEQMNVGRARYTVSFHDGVKLHQDGSPFFDIHTFSNRQKKDLFIRELSDQGYVRA